LATIYDRWAGPARLRPRFFFLDPHHNMLTTPILIAIAIVAAVAIGIGVALSQRGSTQRLAAEHRSHVPNTDHVFAAVVEEDAFDDAPKMVRRVLRSLELVRRLDIPLERLEAHQPTYREERIPKPRGGFRRLEIPDDATKALQRTILHRLLQQADAHPMACGFEQGASIVDAAMPHQQKRVVVKMDIRHFFEHTTSERVQKWFEAIGWESDAAQLLTRLTTYNGHLPQGAPTSPRLSNLVNAPLDHALLLLARRHKGDYSRYADDITMSFDIKRGRVIRGITQVVRRILRSYGYTMHGGAKLQILRQNQRQIVLGLVVNSSVALPRKTRRWLRAVRHRFETGQDASISEQQLKGWEAFALMIETQREE